MQPCCRPGRCDSDPARVDGVGGSADRACSHRRRWVCRSCMQSSMRSTAGACTLPILLEAGRTLWEADAIARRLSHHARSDFWRTGGDVEPDMIRWLSWGKENFMRACDIVHFERGTKQRYGLGPIDPARVEQGLNRFRVAAAILEAGVSGREWLVGDSVSYADFRMATFLPFNDVARLPLDDYPSIGRWYHQLEELDAWRYPFKELDAPELPPIPAGRVTARAGLPQEP